MQDDMQDDMPDHTQDDRTPFDTGPGVPDEEPGKTPSTADLGTPLTRLLALVASTLLFLIVAFMQLVLPSLMPPAPAEDTPGGPDFQSLFMGRMAVRFSEVSPTSYPMIVSELEKVATTDEQWIRIATLYAWNDNERAAEILDDLQTADDPDADTGHHADTDTDTDTESGSGSGTNLEADIGVVRDMLDDTSIDDGRLDDFEERHGWFVELARTASLDRNDPERLALAEGGMFLLVALVVLGATIVGAFVGGTVLLVLGLTLLLSGRFRFRFTPPTVGGSVYLETFAIFVGGFLAVQVIALAVVAALGIQPQSIDAIMVSAALQWTLVLGLFWAVFRGVSFRDFKAQIGWTSGEGVFKEIVLGVAVYLASLPVYAIAVVTSIVLSSLWQVISGADDAPVPNNPMVDIMSSGNALLIAGFASLAVVWAPLVEETVFRGALFRHMSATVGIIGAALFSATLFAGMHGYGVLFLPPLIALGATFAFIRAWRGSIVGCIAAHAAHNGFIMTAMIVIFGLL